MILILVASYTIYYRYHPNIIARIEISAIDDDQYESIGGLSHIKHPEKENFSQLHFNVRVNYSKNIADVQVDLSKTIRELLGEEVYCFGSGWNRSPEGELQHSEEIVIYTGEIQKEKIVDLINEGQLKVNWKADGEKKSKTYNMGELVVFKK